MGKGYLALYKHRMLKKCRQTSGMISSYVGNKNSLYPYRPVYDSISHYLTITFRPPPTSIQASTRCLIAARRKTPWPDFANELYRPGDRRLLAKLVTTFEDKWCHFVGVTDPYDHILGFLN
jgi:hypothetical protein